ncbi:acetolactate decarboxylase [Mycobacterium sp. 050134]|uniref:acetolactate decarboxylase n=1 Tax=Mycobacterium sp. 050134 TaxID=3096111 RepID=UPI002ED99095
MDTHPNPYERFRHWATSLLRHHDGEEVFQFSTIGALLGGVYDGDVTVADILRHGDFGLGTFNQLDGEMVILDGVCYRLRADGSAGRAAPTDRTPFAAVTRFHSDFEIAVDTRTDRAAAMAAIDRRIESPNLIYVVRITGHFAELRTRTVMAQQQPYPPVMQAIQEQAETTFTDVSGTAVGFRTPDFDQGISVAGYHLHFLNDERTAGGHILDFALDRGTIAISGASQLHLSLPTSGPFLGAQLSRPDLAELITKAEGSSREPDSN